MDRHYLRRAISGKRRAGLEHFLNGPHRFTVFTIWLFGLTYPFPATGDLRSSRSNAGPLVVT